MPEETKHLHGIDFSRGTSSKSFWMPIPVPSPIYHGNLMKIRLSVFPLLTGRQRDRRGDRDKQRDGCTGGRMYRRTYRQTNKQVWMKTWPSPLVISEQLNLNWIYGIISNYTHFIYGEITLYWSQIFRYPTQINYQCQPLLNCNRI